MKKNLIIFCFFLLVPFVSEGQLVTDKNVGDVVYLNDGGIIKGKILKWELGGDMFLEIFSGQRIIIAANLISEVRKEELKMRKKGIKRTEIKNFEFRNEGLYHNLALSFPMGSELGVSFTYAIGHRFSRIFGAGVGLGIEDFEVNAASQVVPIFAEIRGFVRDHHISPYYNFRLGYGIPLLNDAFNVIEAKGGLMVHPELGFRFGGKDVWYYMGAGIRFQDVTYTRELPWWQEGVAVDDITFKRIDVKFGMEF